MSDAIELAKRFVQERDDHVAKLRIELNVARARVETIESLLKELGATFPGCEVRGVPGECPTVLEGYVCKRCRAQAYTCSSGDLCKACGGGIGIVKEDDDPFR